MIKVTENRNKEFMESIEDSHELVVNIRAVYVFIHIDIWKQSINKIA